MKIDKELISILVKLALSPLKNFLKIIIIFILGFITILFLLVLCLGPMVLSFEYSNYWLFLYIITLPILNIVTEFLD